MGSMIAGMYAAGRLQEAKDWSLQVDKQLILRMMDISLSLNSVVTGDRIIKELEKVDLDEDTYAPDYYEIVPVEGLRDGLTIVIDGYSLRFDWIDDPEIKTDYAVVDERTEEWLTIVSECWTCEDIVSEIRDNLPGVE